MINICSYKLPQPYFMLKISCIPGDWHCAYILLYGPRVLEVLDEDEKQPAAAEVKMETE